MVSAVLQVGLRARIGPLGEVELGQVFEIPCVATSVDKEENVAPHARGASVNLSSRDKRAEERKFTHSAKKEKEALGSMNRKLNEGKASELMGISLGVLHSVKQERHEIDTRQRDDEHLSLLILVVCPLLTIHPADVRR